VPHPLGILRYYAGLQHEWSEVHNQALITHEPVGVVAVITPWNMPQKTILMKVAPALLAGCTVVVKPAPETPLDALYLAEILEHAGIPPGVFNAVPAGREVGGAPRQPP
jgi:betaine-aldehyde dehydrogenase